MVANEGYHNYDNETLSFVNHIIYVHYISLASWRPIYAATIMPFQHTRGEKGLAQFSTNCVATSPEALLG